MLFQHSPISLLMVGLVPYLLIVLAGPFFISFLQKRYLGQYIREDGPQHHHIKAGTPTGGGVLILLCAVLGLVAAYYILGNWILTPYLVWAVVITLVLGALGFIDDYLKISKKQNKGVSGYTKLAVQLSLGAALGLWLMQTYNISTISVFAEVTGWHWNLGWFFPLFTAFVIAGSSNAVNLTDGLDGLAGSTVLVTLFCLFTVFAGALTLNPQYTVAELAVFALVTAGAVFGFLNFNWNPAKLFMGDTGSLALGGALGAMAILGRCEFYLGLMGIIFVAEALSVILQVASFKTTGKRIFKMSPLHHHFELCGWSETAIVKVFAAVQLLACVIAIKAMFY